jgi:hypothetical protein
VASCSVWSLLPAKKGFQKLARQEGDFRSGHTRTRVYDLLIRSLKSCVRSDPAEFENIAQIKAKPRLANSVYSLLLRSVLSLTAATRLHGARCEELLSLSEKAFTHLGE